MNIHTSLWFLCLLLQKELMCIWVFFVWALSHLFCFFFVIFILCAYQWSPTRIHSFSFFIPIACSLDSGHTKSILMNIFTKTQTYIKITKMRLWLCNGKNKNKEMGAEQRTPEAVFLLFLFAEKHKKYCEHFVYSTKMIHLCQTHWKHKRPTHLNVCMMYALQILYARTPSAIKSHIISSSDEHNKEWPSIPRDTMW